VVVVGERRRQAIIYLTERFDDRNMILDRPTLIRSISAEIWNWQGREETVGDLAERIVHTLLGADDVEGGGSDLKASLGKGPDPERQSF
jgi:hypothetical protein